MLLACYQELGSYVSTKEVTKTVMTSELNSEL